MSPLPRSRAAYEVEPSEFLSAPAVLRRYGVGRMWIERRILDANFPKPIKFGPGVSAVRFWRRADLEQWEREREAMAS
jgi:predicted DNA-binding transcriptional regulator AlpA